MEEGPLGLYDFRKGVHLCGLFLFDAPRSNCLCLRAQASVRNDSQIDLVCSCNPIRLDDRAGLANSDKTISGTSA